MKGRRGEVKEKRRMSVAMVSQRSRQWAHPTLIINCLHRPKALHLAPKHDDGNDGCHGVREGHCVPYAVHFILYEHRDYQYGWKQEEHLARERQEDALAGITNALEEGR